MAWVIFKPSDRRVEEGVPNAASATARVAVLGGTTTSIEVDDQKGGSNLPDWFFPGVYVDAGGVLSEEAPLSGVAMLQAAARGATDALVDLSRAVRAVATYYTWAEGERVRDWIAFTHPGVARVCRSSHWPIAMRIGFCERTGALAVTTLYEQAASAPVPTSAVVLTDPASATVASLTGSAEATRIVAANWGAAPTNARFGSRTRGRRPR